MKRSNPIRSSRLLLPLLLVLGGNAKVDPDRYTAAYATPTYPAPMSPAPVYVAPTYAAPTPYPSYSAAAPVYPSYAAPTPSYLPMPVPYSYSTSSYGFSQNNCNCSIPPLPDCVDYINYPSQGHDYCRCTPEFYPIGCTPQDCKPGDPFDAEYYCWCQAELSPSKQSPGCITLPKSPNCPSASAHGTGPRGSVASTYTPSTPYPSYSAPAPAYPTYVSPAPVPAYPTYTPGPVTYGYSGNGGYAGSSCDCAIPPLRDCTARDDTYPPANGGEYCQCTPKFNPTGCTPQNCKAGEDFQIDYVCFCQAELSPSSSSSASGWNQSPDCITIPQSPNCGSASAHGTGPKGSAALGSSGAGQAQAQAQSNSAHAHSTQGTSQAGVQSAKPGLVALQSQDQDIVGQGSQSQLVVDALPGKQASSSGALGPLGTLGLGQLSLLGNLLGGSKASSSSPGVLGLLNLRKKRSPSPKQGPILDADIQQHNQKEKRLIAIKGLEKNSSPQESQKVSETHTSNGELLEVDLLDGL